MGMGINTDVGGLDLWRTLAAADSSAARSSERIASGQRINSAADDPAGLVASEKLRAVLGGIDAAVSGNERTVNMVQTADAAAGQVQDLLHKARSLVVDTANSGVLDDSMRSANQSRLDEILKSVDRIAGDAQFGSKNLLDGSLQVTPVTADGASEAVAVAELSTATVGTGARYGDGQAVTAYGSIADLASGSGSGGALVDGDSDTLEQALGVIDQAIGQVAGQRGQLGALQADTLQPSIDSLRSAYENVQAGESTVSDSDLALEMSRRTADRIKQEVGAALFGQRGVSGENLLRLLQGG